MKIENYERYLMAGDNVSGMKIYEIINKYFGKNYKGYMKAWFDIDDDFAAWFPTITKTNDRPNGNYGGRRNCSNTISSDWKTIIEINHDSDETLHDAELVCNKHRLVFAKINGEFHFLGVFDRTLAEKDNLIIKMHYQVADGIDLKTFKMIQKDK